MNYNEMSDDAIAKGVVMAMGGKEMSDGVFLCENKRYDICSPKSSFNFDPCNSWSDAGPIIEKSGIGIMPMLMGWRAATERGCRDYTSIANENPLRAAMIVFLMMQEAK